MFKLAAIILVLQSTNAIQTHDDIILTVPEETPNPNYINRDEEPARLFLQRYNSFNPVVLLVDDTPQSRNDAANFIKNVYKLSSKVRNVNFMVIKFNASGASDVLESIKHNRDRFEKILTEGITENSSSFLGHSNVSRSAVFFGILKAVQDLPPHSGIAVFAGRDVEDETLSPHALVEVAKKSIQVFVFWGGKNEEKLLKELAIRSNGGFLVSPSDPSEIYYEKFLDNIGTFSPVSLILSRVNLLGENNLNFPIDSDVTGIHISVVPGVTGGVLTTPKGYKIDILGGEDVSRFSAGSFIKQDSGTHEIHLNTTTAATRSVGFWRLRLTARALFNVTIFAHTQLTAKAEIKVQKTEGSKTTKTVRKKFVTLGVTGDASTIHNISFVDRDGKPILNDVKFTLNNDWGHYLTEDVENIETNKEVNISVEDLPKEPFYAVINGKDTHGNDFRRLSYVQEFSNKEFFLPPITIDVGLGSELITQPQPFRNPQIFFEVTNNGNSPSLMRFYVRDERSLLQSMVPWYKWISPQETATVRVTLITRAGSYQDVIAFTAAGSETATKKVIVDVGQWHQDRRDPDLHYQFLSDCTNVLLGSCEDGTWTVEIKAKDRGSGLLQVASIPKGVYFPQGFTSGTTEEVTGYFSESCCNPDLKVIAYDRQNNRYTRHINAYWAIWSPGAIAAICLGIILLIILIIVIVVLIKKCKCPKCSRKSASGSYNLPTYRGPRRP